MGRFYKATSGKFIDNKIYETPFDEIAETIGAVDRNVDNAYAMNTAIQDSANTKMLETDDAAVRERYKYFQDIADASASRIDKDPMNFIKETGNLRRTSRDLSRDMQTGVIGRAQEQFDSYNKDVAELEKRTDLTQATKDLKKSHILHQYKNAGSLNFNADTGSFNKISDFNSDLVSEITDENKYLAQVGQGFEYQSKGGGSTRVGNLRGSGLDMLITSKSNISERSASRVQAFIEKDLDSKNYIKSREQYHQMNQDINGPSDLLNEQGEPMTPREMAEEDKRRLIEKGVIKLTGKKGSYSQTASVIPGQTGGVASGGRIKELQIDDVSNTVVGNQTKAKVSGMDARIDAILKLGPNAGEELVGMKNKLYSLGFGDVSQLYSKTTNGFNQSKLANLTEALSTVNLFPEGASAITKKKMTLEYLNSKAPQKAIKTGIIPTFEQGEKEATPNEIKTATKNVSNMINFADQNQVIGDVYITVDGVTKKQPKGMTFSQLGTDEGDYIYTKPTGTTKSRTVEVGSDADGWMDSNGQLIVAKNDKLEDQGIFKGDTLTRAQIAKNLPNVKVATEKRQGTNIYNNTDNLIQVRPGDVSQETYMQYNPDGTAVEVKRYRAKTTLLRTAKGGGKGEHVQVDMILDPEEYQNIIK